MSLDVTPTESGARLRRFREAVGVSRERLAYSAGLASQTVYRSETGRAIPTPASRRMIAQALGVDVGVIWPDTPELGGLAREEAVTAT